MKAAVAVAAATTTVSAVVHLAAAAVIRHVSHSNAVLITVSLLFSGRFQRDGGRLLGSGEPPPPLASYSLYETNNYIAKLTNTVLLSSRLHNYNCNLHNINGFWGT